jgi:hypothetical protein
MDFLLGLLAGIIGLLLAQGLALVLAMWSHNRRKPKCPLPDDINFSSR